MSELVNFPMVNQEHEPTVDGMPDENAGWNCVPASMSAALMYLLPGTTFDGDELKDAVYGQGYIGAMAPSQFVGYCAQHGVNLAPVNGEPLALMAAVHTGVAAGSPVLATIPSSWGLEPPPLYGTTHVVCFYEEHAGGATAMNPWGGFAQNQSNAWWTERFRLGQVWRMTRMSMTPTGWHDDGTTLTAPNGKVVTQGFRSKVLNWPGGWEANNVPLENAVGLPSVELGNPSIGPGTRQIFTQRALGWTTKMDVYVIWAGQELMAWIHKADTVAAPPYPDVRPALATAEAKIAKAVADLS